RGRDRDRGREDHDRGPDRGRDREERQWRGGGREGYYGYQSRDAYGAERQEDMDDRYGMGGYDRVFDGPRGANAGHGQGSSDEGYGERSWRYGERDARRRDLGTRRRDLADRDRGVDRGEWRGRDRGPGRDWDDRDRSDRRW